MVESNMQRKIIVDMKNKYLTHSTAALIILVCLSVLFAMVGCGFDPFPSSSVPNFRTGKEGLELSLEGADRIYIYGSNASLVEPYLIRVENKGATKIMDQDIFLKVNLLDGFLNNFENSHLTLNSLKDFEGGQGPTELGGKTKDHRTGELVTHTINLKPVTPPSRGLTSRISIDLCYKYETILTDSVCINTKLQQNKGCTKNRYAYHSGQGAPINIKEVEIKEVLGDSTGSILNYFVVFVIENSKQNIFSLADTSGSFKEGCLAKSDINKLELTEAKLGKYDLECQEKIIEIKDKERRVVCELEDKDFGTGDFGHVDTLLTLKLEYGYSENLVKEVDLIREDFYE